MSPRVPDLHHAIAAFRREHALSFVSRLSGRAPELARARRSLLREASEELLADAAAQQAITPAEHAAIAAHFVRAAVEQVYARARFHQAEFGGFELTIEGETRKRRQLCGEFATTHLPVRRQALLRAIDASLAPLLDEIELGMGEADEAAREWVVRLKAPRHADAGPEKGNHELARKWLDDTRELAQEAVAFALKQASGAQDGGDALWALCGPVYTGLFSREGRMRRLGGDFAELGLRGALSAYGRVAPAHDGPFPSGQVAIAQVPNDVRVASWAFELGIASELGAADGVGRALAYALASPALPTAQRHPTVGSVARAFGSFSVQRFANPRFLARFRGLRAAEAAQVARLSAAYLIIESRFSAAAVLARALHGPDRRARAAELAEAALTRTLPQSLGALFVTRLSPGGPFRGKIWGLAIGDSLRERFDEDWFRNPRAAEPLRGAAARAGEFSVEAFATELGADVERGKRWLSELF
jgi:hypothetical protein